MSTVRPAPEGASILPAATAASGVRHMALGAFWFSVMAVLVKTAGRNLPSQEIVLVRGVVTLVLSIAMVLRAGISPWGARERRPLLVLRGIFGFAALSFFYTSLVHLPLAEATLIQYTNPVFTAILAAWLLGERMGRREVGCVAASLAGVVLVVRPAALLGGAASVVSPHAALIALAGAMCSAMAYVTIRRIKGENPLVIVFYFPLVTVPATLPFTLPQWVWPTPLEWLVLAGIGIATQIAQVNMTRGLQLEPAGRATAVAYLQVVFAAVWGVAFFGERLDAWVLAGAGLVLASTVVLARGRRAAEGVAAETEA
ncbi:MAG TPA: DMT family transporter [Longimicrobium sp.]